MSFFKVNSTILTLLPSLALIPVSIEVVQGIHFGGIDVLLDFFISSVHPSTESVVIQSAFNGLKITIATAFFSWAISLIIGTLLGFISSSIFWENIGSYKWTGSLIRRLLAIPRSMHEVIWGLLLLQLIGLNEWVAILAIAIPYSCLMARVISDQLDSLDYLSLLAIKQVGSNSLTAFITSLIPPMIPKIVTYGGYRLECAIRGATLLGIFGLGGIGTELQLTLQSLEFREMWTSLWMLGSLMIFIEISLNFLRDQYSNKNNNLFDLSSILLISSLIISIWCLKELNIDMQTEIGINPINVPQFSEIRNAVFTLPIFNLINGTILITIMAAGIAIGIPPLCLMIFNNSRYNILLDVLWIFLRLIPAPLIALLLLLSTKPSISVAALALGLNNIGVMGRILKENINQQNNSNFDALQSSGVTDQVSWIYGKLSPKSKSYLAYAAYRTDVILRETAVVGIVGGVGLGWQLQESLSSFDWAQVSVITGTFAMLTLTGEHISEKIREYWVKTKTEDSLSISLQS